MEAGAPAKCFKPRDAAAAATAAVPVQQNTTAAVCTSSCTARTHGAIESSGHGPPEYHRAIFTNVALLTRGRAQGNPPPTGRVYILHEACTAVEQARMRYRAACDAEDQPA